MPKVTITKIKTKETEKVYPISAAVSLLNNLLRSGFTEIQHKCGGKVQCGTCRVRIISGHKNLNPMNDREQAFWDKRNSPKDTRLACQTFAFGDIEIQIP